MKSAASSPRPWCECDPEYDGHCPYPCQLDADEKREAASAAQRHPWEHGPVVTRLLALVNVTLIPYVAWKFPAEARAYTRRSFEAVLRGR